jgi:hypothetical protein
MRQPIAYLSRIWQNSLCAVIDAWRARHGQAPSLGCWLRAHPAVADSIKWQFTFDTSAYDIPETAKRAWPAWTLQEQQELTRAYQSAWGWLYRQPAPFANLNEAVVYPPVNLEDTTTSAAAPYVEVDTTWARDLYVRWMGLNLAVEIGGHVPWSVTSYSSEQLQVLFDSASFLTLAGSGNFVVCTGNPAHPNFVKRKDNLGLSMIAPPRYTLAFLRNTNLVGATRAETISRLLDWARDNLAHFFGAPDYGTMEQHWQYRGLPPITRVLEGTTSTYPGSPLGFAHWTAGCHGTAGLLRNVLRAVNIPVHILRVCTHGQLHFLTEGTYLDHGDDPYNSGFKASGLPAADLLLDEATYTSWFGTNQDNHDTNCANVGRRATELTPP